MADFDEYDLDDAEVEKLANRQKELDTEAKTAARVGMDLIDLIVKGVVANQKATAASGELKTQYTRIAKARARQFEDIIDVDFKAKKIILKKRGKNAENTSVDGEEGGYPLDPQVV